MLAESTVESVLVGLPTNYGTPDAPHPMDRPWSSAIAKQPASGPVWAGRYNLAGDAQADLEAHGGPEKAILAYAARHYPIWHEELGRELPHGAFGENLTIAGLDETEVCIGDVFAIGEAVVQVSQPRVPCFKLAYRWRIKDLTARVRRTGRAGWYLRVLEPGWLEAGAEVELRERACPQWSVLSAIEIEQRRRKDPEAARRLATCESLTTAWREWLIAEAALA